MIERAVRKLTLISAPGVVAAAAVSYWLVTRPYDAGAGSRYDIYLILPAIQDTRSLLAVTTGVSAAILAAQARRWGWFRLLVAAILLSTYGATVLTVIALNVTPTDANQLLSSQIFQPLYFFVLPALPVLAALAYTFRFRERRDDRHAPAALTGDDSLELTISPINKQL